MSNVLSRLLTKFKATQKINNHEKEDGLKDPTEESEYVLSSRRR